MQKKSNFRFELLMDAGNGAQKAGDILIKAFAKKGILLNDGSERALTNLDL